MAAALLTLVIAFMSGGALWLTLGPRIALSSETEQNDLLNLIVYVVALLPVAFAVVFFVLEVL